VAALAMGGCSAFDPHILPAEEVYEAGTATGASDAASDAASGAESGSVSFGRDIRPLMDRDNGDGHPHGCKLCHYGPSGPGTTQTGLQFDTLGALRRSSPSHPPTVKAGDPAGSVLVQKLRGTTAFGQRMPRDGAPNHYWTEAEIQLVEQWIAEGAQGADSE
jgi:hypothetical protein